MNAINFHMIQRSLLASLSQDGQRVSNKRLRERLRPLLAAARYNGTLGGLLGQMVRDAGLDRLLPDRYARFQPPVTEGLTYVLAALPHARLTEKVAAQILLPEDADVGMRLCALIEDMPTLQKLGQILARSPGLDPEFRHSLIQLEDNLQAVAFAHVRPSLLKALQQSSGAVFTMPTRILAEATVCVVLPCQVKPRPSEAPVEAVIKLRKPKVVRHIKGELKIWDGLADFLDDQRDQWQMGEFRFRGTVDQVRHLLANELDLSAEQRNLKTAAHYYRRDNHVIIPTCLPGATPGMTVMARQDGTKITDVSALSKRQKRLLAGALAKVCILRPIQDLEEVSIFHGDPHAGNIAYRFEGGQPKLIFYDWGMLGRLTRRERLAMAIMAFGLVLNQPTTVFHAADLITGGQLSHDKSKAREILECIEQVNAHKGIGIRGVVTRVERVFEALTYRGVVFSADLLMYEKSLVTLKGVLADIEPTFNRDDHIALAAMYTFLTDMMQLRYQRVLIEELWSLYRSGLGNFFRTHWELLRFVWKLWHSAGKIIR